ncbi:ImmA/IrrE family metallo-endopeptidase [Brevibacterium sp. 91QC2O2]|uniref:ImmA/IrrE family metallo-endopeptidase n=1 Tax=Brevibacterium sp. 91QC2O2 TaxID=2968458 RepID=UPI00211CF4E0|nr:ImmA/IrrE family metallo-endopeptidase [Brevibacterium sp. 91QC2O2]MCQ9367983.1 ImmA/IrrE family metallo-endopeptidase [Brevibacterium sp. 91QC2O2]
MNIPHPWHDLQRRGHVVISWRADMPAGMYASTNGADLIWMSTRIQQTQRRCSLMHELVHIDMGHRCGQSPGVEARVQRETARRLIPLECLCDTARWAGTVPEAAEALWVTDDVLRDRLTCLTPGEREVLERIARAHWQQP